MSTPQLPRRCCLCLRCRTAIFPGTECECQCECEYDRHSESAGGIACFDKPEGRVRIVEACWGNGEQRKAVLDQQNLAQRRMLLGSMGGLVLGSSVAFGVVGAGMIVTGVLGSAVGAMLARRRCQAQRKDPQGAMAPVICAETQLRGTLSGDHALISPAGGHECLAYSLALCVQTRKGERIVYRDGVTSGFHARLGSGESLRVPAGRLRFVGQAPEILDVDNPELEAYLQEIDPLRQSSSDFQPLPFDFVREHVLFHGDTVELGGEFVPVVSASAPASLYRERIATHLRPVSLPLVRLVV